MAFDENQFTTMLTTSVTDSFNSAEDNSETTTVDVADSFNDDTTLTDVGNTDVNLTDSFHNDSYNTDIDYDDRDTTDSFNDTWSFTDSSETDNSVNAGVRSYDTGFSGLGGAAAGGAAGEVMINNQNTIVDQSLNSNVAAAGPVFQVAGASSVVASGTDSMAAGDDIDIDTYVDQSTNISADGDVLIESTKTVDWSINSGNTTNTSFTYTDESIDVDIDDSWNEANFDTTVTDSFTSEDVPFDYTDVDVDVDAIVGSTVTDVGDIDVAF